MLFSTDVQPIKTDKGLRWDRPPLMKTNELIKTGILLNKQLKKPYGCTRKKPLNFKTMIKGIVEDKEKLLGTFVDGGSVPLNKHSFVSDELNQKKAEKTVLKAAADALRETGGDTEMIVKFRLNQTGNIFYSTTSDLLQAETKKLFDSVTVLFVAMAQALKGKGKDLFDYDSWSNVIIKSGYFIEVSKYRKTLSIENNSIALNTQIIGQLLPGLTTGNSLEIAKGVLSAINGEYSSSRMDAGTKLGHILFICEELFGAPSITVRLFYLTKQSHEKITSSPCHRSVSESFEQLQEGNTFLFVSPDTIAEFGDKFGETSEALKNLIKKLSDLI